MSLSPSAAGDYQSEGPPDQGNDNSTDDMRSGPDHRPRGRFHPNRPFRQQPRGPQPNQTFDSNGPEVRVRGTAQQVFERYVALAREAASTGDRIAAENLYQHAEHYFRISNARREGNSQQPSRPVTPADVTPDAPETGSGDDGVDRAEPSVDDDHTYFLTDRNWLGNSGGSGSGDRLLE
jgi:hypothetical protein